MPRQLAALFLLVVVAIASLVALVQAQDRPGGTVRKPGSNYPLHEAASGYQPVIRSAAERRGASTGGRLQSVLKRPSNLQDEKTETRGAVQPPAAQEQTSSRRTARSSWPPRAATSASDLTSKPDDSPAAPAARAADDQVLLRSQSPAVRVETVGPRAIMTGKPGSYQVTLINEEAVASRDIELRVALPTWVEVASSETSAGTLRQTQQADQMRLVWDVPELAAHAQHQLTLSLVPQTSRSFELDVQWTLRPPAVAAEIEVQHAELAVSLSGPTEVLYGEAKVYTITVANTGSGDAENVSLQLASGASETQATQLGTLAAGQRQKIEVELTAGQQGQIEIRAVARGDGGVGAEATETIQVRRPNLQVALAGPVRHFAGALARYRVQVTNPGNAVAQQVKAQLTLPPGAEYVAGLQDATDNGDTLNWSVGDLEAGGQRQFDIQCRLTGAGKNELAVRLQGASQLTASHTCTTEVEAFADLKLRVNDPQGPNPVGQEVVYEVVVLNRGSKAAEQIHVVAQFSEGIEPVKVAGGRAELVPGQVLFHPLDRLEAGQQITLKITARADQAGNHRFRTEVKCGDPEARLVSEDTTRFFALGAREK